MPGPPGLLLIGTTHGRRNGKGRARICQDPGRTTSFARRATFDVCLTGRPGPGCPQHVVPSHDIPWHGAASLALTHSSARMDKVAPTATTVWLSEATGRCARSPPARAADRSRWRGSVPGCVRAVGDRDLREQRLERGGRFRLLAHSRSSLAEPPDTGNGRDIQRAVLPGQAVPRQGCPGPRSPTWVGQHHHRRLHCRQRREASAFRTVASRRSRARGARRGKAATVARWCSAGRASSSTITRSTSSRSERDVVRKPPLGCPR